MWVALFAGSTVYWFLPAGLRMGALWLVPQRHWWKLAVVEWAAILALSLARDAYQTPLALISSTLLPWGIYAGVIVLVGRPSPTASDLKAIPRVLLCGVLAALLNSGALTAIEWFDSGSVPRNVGHMLFAFTVGDFIGVLVVAPLLMALRDRVLRRSDSWRALLADGWVFAPLIVAAATHFLPLPPGTKYPLVYAMFPLFWLAFRSGWRPTSVALAGLTAGFHLVDPSLLGNWRPGQLQLMVAGAGTGALLLGLARDSLNTQARALAATVEMLSIRSKALTHVAERLTSQQEDERRRIGAELHDQLGQDMTAIATRLRVLMRTRENPALVDSGLQAIQGLVDDAHTHLRNVIHELHPLALDRFGLARALVEGPLAAMARDAGVDYHGDNRGDVDKLPPPIATALYRICQEAATNCVRHGCGGRVEICLSLTPSEYCDELVLKIEDDAGEIEIDPARPGHGLQGIRDRANAIGADYYFHRESGHPRHWLQLRVYKAEARA